MKVLYGSSSGFHAVDLDSASVYDIYLPKHAQVGEKINQFYEIFGGSEIHFDNQILPNKGPVTPHTIVTLPNTNGMQLLLCYDNEGVYVNTYGKVRDLYNNCRKLMPLASRCRRTLCYSGASCRPVLPTLVQARSWVGGTRPLKSG